MGSKVGGAGVRKRVGGLPAFQRLQRIPEAADRRPVVDEQSRTRGRIGEILAAKGYISATMARFFSMAKVNERGEIDYSAS